VSTSMPRQRGEERRPRKRKMTPLPALEDARHLLKFKSKHLST
jgi:hypothetical protein